MQEDLPKLLFEAKSILEESKGARHSKPQRIEKAILLASAILRAANALMTPKEERFGEELSKMMKDPKGKLLTVDVTDQVFRSRSDLRAADQMIYLLRKYGIPQFLNGIQKAGLYCFKGLGTFLSQLFVPLAKWLIRQETSRVILQGEEMDWLKHMKARKADGVRVNLNHLGEAILGEEEAQSRVERYLKDLEQPEVDYISVKVSTLFSQIHPLAWKETLEKLAVPYRKLLRKAQQFPCITKEGIAQPKFINLDMEEYKDLRLTVDLFKKVLSESEFFSLSAGIVLQSYVPDSYDILLELTSFAKERVSRGGAPIKVRIVKGANLAMEKVEASIKGWPQAPYEQKSDADALFKKMVEWALSKENAPAVRIGIGSHNLLDISYAMLLREEQEVQPYVVFEMLEGMADASRKVVQQMTNEMVLYCPAASPDEFQNAVAYLVRRLDENTAPENFLHVSFGLQPGTKAWQHQVDLFAHACEESDQVDTRSRRTQNRLEEDYVALERCFVNEPDTDWSLHPNRTWANQILNEWHQKRDLSVPAVIAGKEISHVASGEEIQKALECIPSAQKQWSGMDVDRRLEILKKAAENFRRGRGDLLGAMLLETSKPFLEGDAEVSEAVDFIEYYRQSFKDLEGLSDIAVKPIGPVLVASPWNFPCSIPTGGISAALIAGNAVIFKPAPEAVLVGYHVAKLFWEAGVPKEVLQFVPCKDEEASALVKDSRISLVVLTGATDTAKLFLRMRPEIDLMAETGGKNAIIVTALADRDLAVKDVVQSAFGFSGQKCSACSLLVLEAEVYDDPKFRKQLVDAVESLSVGSPWNPQNRVIPLIRPPTGALLKAIQEDVIDEEWLVKPKWDHENRKLISPGIKWGVKPGSFLHQTELFGPVLSVMKAKDLSEAIDIVNQTPYGLTSGLHSLDDREHEFWLRKIQAGNCYINRGITGAIVERQPFGGCKASSFGRGIKAGGPNYLFQFLQFEQDSLPTNYAAYPDELKNYPKWARLSENEASLFHSSVGNYSFFYQHYFSKEHDPMKVLGQDNIQCYVPYSKVIIRLSSKDSDLDILRTYAAAKIAGTPLEFSSRFQRENLSFLPFVIETDELFLSRVGKDRIRLLSKPDKILLEGMAKAGVSSIQSSVLANGRLEMLHVLREVSISKDYHRYGNLGAREYEPRKSGFFPSCQRVADADQNTCCRCEGA